MSVSVCMIGIVWRFCVSLRAVDQSELWFVFKCCIFVFHCCVLCCLIDCVMCFVSLFKSVLVLGSLCRCQSLHIVFLCLMSSSMYCGSVSLYCCRTLVGIATVVASCNVSVMCVTALSMSCAVVSVILCLMFVLM